MEKKNIFTRKGFVVLFAVIAALSWGGAYPFIKLGMQEFQIADFDTGSKILFAGVRFFLAGVGTLALSVLMKQSIKIESKSNFSWLLLFGLVNTALHYFFFYIGLSNCNGSKASIIDSLGTFWLIFLACIFFRERLDAKRIIGCVLGFCGILLVNLSADGSNAMSFMGEGMLFLNTICAAFGGVITRVVTKKMNPVAATGYSLLFGGAMLLAAGVIMGGKLEHITVKGIGIIAVLIAISMTGFILYNQLLRYNPIGEIAIFNALIPVFGTLLCCVLLGEAFYIKYLFAIMLISLGILAINKKSKHQTA